METLKNADVLRGTLDLKNRNILDIGCGEGHLSRMMARAGGHVIGLESSAKQIDKALKGQEKLFIPFLQAWGQILPFKEACFDILVFFNSLHHISHAVHNDCFLEAYRVLKPNGYIYISEPIAEGPHFELLKPIDDERHVRAQAYETIKTTEQFGFRQLEEKIYNHPVKRTSYEELREKLIGPDPAREAVFDQKENEIRAAFKSLGRIQDDGSSLFDQPTRMNLLQKRN